MTVLRASYREIDPDKPCPTCHAGPREFCLNRVTGQQRRVPCVRRPRFRPAGEVATAPPIDAEVVELDYSEPRHQIERTNHA